MSVKVSPKYQVVIPEVIRKQVSISPGMEVEVLAKNGVIYVIPVRSLEEISKKLSGKFKNSELKNLREKKDKVR